MLFFSSKRTDLSQLKLRNKFSQHKKNIDFARAVIERTLLQGVTGHRHDHITTMSQAQARHVISIPIRKSSARLASTKLKVT